MMNQYEQQGIYQIQGPAPYDTDPHPRLQLDGWGIHAGNCFLALMPDGWHDITLEVDWDVTGPECWYISNPKYEGISPIGLFVKVKRY